MPGKKSPDPKIPAVKQEPQPYTWEMVHKEMSQEGMKQSFCSNLQYNLAKDRYTTNKHDDFVALATAIRDRIVERWIVTQQSYHKKNVKRIYYLSMEFLIGRLLATNTLNLNLWDQTKGAMEEMGIDLEEMREEEGDAGLGNGGLGRLAACFLDSMATLGIPAHGYGIRYEYGIFKQKIVNGYQVEQPDEWLKYGNPWEFARPEYSQTVKFYGETNVYHDKNGRFRVEWRNTKDVIALPFDIPVVGYHNDVVNTLRLWSAKSTEEFDFDYFNTGDYERAVYDKMFTENISKVLYPNDSTSVGRELRLKQEYFFTAAAIADIIRRYKVENHNFRHFPDKVAVQLNDTHPALAVAELMRILIDEEELDWDTAWDLVVRTFAYTNHTVMPEALECWPIPLFERVLPRHTQIIYEINYRFLREVASHHPGDNDLLRRVSLIDEGEPKKVRMAHLAVVGSHSVNGVSELHSAILRTRLFKDFYEIFPEKFNNKTNGVTPRRWLRKANPGLSSLITKAIGDRWVTNLYALEKLIPFAKDRAFQKKWGEVKAANKLALVGLVEKSAGVKLNPESMFDVQVKRIHEYKRQLLFAFYIVGQYLKLKDDPNSIKVPRTFIVAGKAAPGYFMAKRTIKFITAVGDVINRDKAIKDKLKLVFLEDYRVSLAEKIFPASDLSEQISTAGMEASGTGCMKFMLNGALTVGTLDGANIEMVEAVGRENIYIFGLTAQEIENYGRNGYDPREFIRNSPLLERIFKTIESNFFSPMEPGIFDPITGNLRGSDPFFVCADFEAYQRTQDGISEDYLDQADWLRRAILNVAKSGRFSSDRTIMEYARDIWNIPYHKFQ
jgi:starch phosphorylase